MDQFNVELDLLSIAPEALEATLLLDLNPGGQYEHEADEGVIELDGMTLVMNLGSNHYEIPSGGTFSDQTMITVANDDTPLYQYPFDTYIVTMPISSRILDQSDPNNVTVSLVVVKYQY